MQCFGTGAGLRSVVNTLYTHRTWGKQGYNIGMYTFSLNEYSEKGCESEEMLGNGDGLRWVKPYRTICFLSIKGLWRLDPYKLRLMFPCKKRCTRKVALLANRCGWADASIFLEKYLFHEKSTHLKLVLWTGCFHVFQKFQLIFWFSFMIGSERWYDRKSKSYAKFQKQH